MRADENSDWCSGAAMWADEQVGKHDVGRDVANWLCTNSGVVAQFPGFGVPNPGHRLRWHLAAPFPQITLS
jgi:hypothetical protein